MHSWKKKLVVSQLALACTLAITSQANAATNGILVKLTILSITTTTPPMLMTFTMMVM